MEVMASVSRLVVLFLSLHTASGIYGDIRNSVSIAGANDIQPFDVHSGTKGSESGFVLMGDKLVLRDEVFGLMVPNSVFFNNASSSMTNTSRPWEKTETAGRRRLRRSATKWNRKRRKKGKKRKNRKLRKPNSWRKSFFTLNERLPDPRQILSKQLIASSSVELPARDSSKLLCPVWPTDPRIIVNCSNGRRVRSRCAVRCAPGFRMSNEHKSNRRCRPAKRGRRGKSGRQSPQAFWSGRDENYKCVSSCEPLRAPPNGSLKCAPSNGEPSTTLTSQSCQLVCDDGYDVMNSDVRNCQSDGTWSGRTGSCQIRNSYNGRSRRSFVRHQVLECGDVVSVTSFVRDHVTYLVAGDTTGDRIRIYKWVNGSFNPQPWQEIYQPNPTKVEVVARQQGKLWLFAGNRHVTNLYRESDDGRFNFSHSSTSLTMTSRSDGGNSDGIDFISLNGEIYRCTGQNRPGRSVVVVQKLEENPDGRDFFKRVMRRRMRGGETVFQCSMFVTNNQIETIVTLNRPDGRGRVVVGRPRRGRMVYTDVLKKKDLRMVSDITSFRILGDNYFVVGQAAAEGRCFVYKKLRSQPGVGD